MPADTVDDEYHPTATHSTLLDAEAVSSGFEGSRSNMKGKGKLPNEAGVNGLPPEIIEQ